MQKSPYKFLDSYSKEDRDIFFGRDREIEELYSRVYESRILLVYGISGTGKSSLINCGLANKFSDSDWLPVNVRRGTNINKSLADALVKESLTNAPVTGKNQEHNIVGLVQSVYLDHFKPVYLIFDQFEELFIFAGADEKAVFINNVRALTDSYVQCRFIFSIREEYLAGLTEFERVIPAILSNRIRIEKMSRQNALKVIEGPCISNNISVEPGFAERVLEKLNPSNPEIELTWLQVYLDRIFRIASEGGVPVDKLSKDLIDKAGEVKDLLGSFLEEQISQLDDPESGMVVLKSFVSVRGTRLRITEEYVEEYSKNFGKGLEEDKITGLIQTFIRLRILRDKDENGMYELRHDSLAAKIFEMITMVEKELLEVRQFLENAWNDYEKRQVLLSAEDLNYIAPYQDKVFLNEKIQNFIARSKWALHRAKRRKQNILAAAALIIIAVLSFFTVWALRERDNATRQQLVANEQRDKAEREKAAADSARQEAVRAGEEALMSRNIAVEQSTIAENQRRLAVRNALEAENQRKIAVEQSDSANRASRRAAENQRLADEQRIEALRLRMLSAGKAVSIKSLQLQGQKDLQALLAYQAYVFNRTNGGIPNDPDIFTALYNVVQQYGSINYKVFEGHTGEIKSIAFIPGSSYFYSSGFDARLARRNLAGSPREMEFILSGPEVTEVLALSPDKKWLACGFRNGTIRIFSLDGGKETPVKELKNHSLKINSLRFSSDSRFLFSASLDSQILKWDISAGNSTRVETGNTRIVYIDLADQFDIIAGITADGGVQVIDLPKQTTSLRIGPAPGKSPKTLSFKPGEKLLAIGYSDGTLDLWDIDLKTKTATINAHTAEITAVRFNNPYFQMATAGKDRNIKIWDTRDLTLPPIRFSDNEGFVMTVEFTPDGRHIISGTYEGANNLVARPVNADHLSEEVNGILSRVLTQEEWATYIGRDIDYEKLVYKPK